ncbi:hypothetical protein JCM9140_725 [Halalkalibacter wakoensis JCM 9140]|uniref:DUF1694 domain-containing protein n=1 Tax=Halalkalibacter wakoensis JCM 9140 TaxID=1236970 RepID=W4PZ56_9BACI|nr:YueI family protein [Halalkalibacter wakoensis]GAE24773.1 hypothetical protein JCM9140_725 [Halalkalibacter wakoensis JCM 9140]
MGQKVKEVIDRALYGTPEIKPEEKNLFLSTFLERIHIALTKKQVVHKGMYPEVVEIMKEKKNLHLYINGNLNYGNYSNYVQQASKSNIRFTIVTPKKQTPFGLVLADETQAINRNNIFIQDELYDLDMEESINL